MPALPNCNARNLSRHELLNWVNSTVNGQYKKVEELCSGAAYCQMMEIIFPNCIGAKKIKTTAKLEHEYMHNLKLLQASFTRLHFDKPVPIDRIIKGRFQDNLEFLQWFQKFFITNCSAAGEDNAMKVMEHESNNSKSSSIHDLDLEKETILNTEVEEKELCERVTTDSPTNEMIIRDELAELSLRAKHIAEERDTGYNQLVEIENLLKESVENHEHVEWCENALKRLYASEDDD